MAINKRKRAKVIAILSISAALIVVLQVLAQVIGHFTAFSLALGLLPVLVVAQLRDWKSGLFLGTVFGLCSLVIAAVLYAGVPAWETVIYPHISVLPRAIVGLVTSLVATAIGKALDKRDAAAGEALTLASADLTEQEIAARNKKLRAARITRDYFCSFGVAFLGVLLNAVGFLGMFLATNSGVVVPQEGAEAVVINFQWVLTTIVSVNTIIEAVVFPVVTAAIVQALRRARVFKL